MSGSKVGEAYVEISGRLDKLEGDLKRASKKANTATKKMSRGFKRVASAVTSVRSAIGGMAAALAAYKITAAIKNNLDFLDSLDKTSKRIGITTAFLQEAKFAAAQSGVKFETLAMAMQRFTRRSAEAAKGTGEAKNALAELGIQLTDASGNIRSTEMLFRDAMTALSLIKDPADKLRLAFKLFDSEGASLVQMTSNFSNLTDKMKESGDVVRNTTIVDAVNAKDKLDALSTTITARLSRALVDLSPLLIVSAEALAEVARRAGVAWARLSDLFNLDPKNLEAARVRQDELHKSMDRLHVIRMAQEKLLKSGDRLTERRRHVAKRTLAATMKQLQIEREELAVIDARIEKLTTLSRVEDKGGTTSSDEIRAQQEKNAALRDQENIEKDSAKARKARYREQVDSEKLIRQLKKDGAAESAREFSEMVAEQHRRLGELNEAYEFTERLRVDGIETEKRLREENISTWQKGVADIKTLSDDLSSSVSSSLAGMVAEGRIRFAELGQAFVQEFTQRVLKSLVFDQIFGALRGVAGSFGGAQRTPAAVDGGGSWQIIRGTEAQAPAVLSAPGPGAAAAGPPNVTIINQSAESVQATSGVDGSIDVFIGGQAARNVANGGAMARAIEGRYGLRPKALMR